MLQLDGEVAEFAQPMLTDAIFDLAEGQLQSAGLRGRQHAAGERKQEVVFFPDVAGVEILERAEAGGDAIAGGIGTGPVGLARVGQFVD